LAASDIAVEIKPFGRHALGEAEQSPAMEAIAVERPMQGVEHGGGARLRRIGRQLSRIDQRAIVLERPLDHSGQGGSRARARILRSIRASAIWIAFSAALLRKLSETTHMVRPCSTVGSLRMRLT